MGLDKTRQENTSVSSGPILSTTSGNDNGAVAASMETDYALMTENNKRKLPSHNHAATHKIRISSQQEEVRCEISRFNEPSHFRTVQIGGFFLSKYSMAPTAHPYHKFNTFPKWNRAKAPTKPTTTITEESLFLSQIDNELWDDFRQAFHHELKKGDRNLLIFQWTSGLLIVLITALSSQMIPDDRYFDPGLVVILFILFAILYICLRPLLFDKIDKVAKTFYSRFAAKGIRISIVYYSKRKGDLTYRSRYLVFTSLPHRRTLNLV